MHTYTPLTHRDRLAEEGAAAAAAVRKENDKLKGCLSSLETEKKRKRKRRNETFASTQTQTHTHTHKLRLPHHVHNSSSPIGFDHASQSASQPACFSMLASPQSVSFPSFYISFSPVKECAYRLSFLPSFFFFSFPFDSHILKIYFIGTHCHKAQNRKHCTALNMIPIYFRLLQMPLFESLVTMDRIRLF